MQNKFFVLGIVTNNFFFFHDILIILYRQLIDSSLLTNLITVHIFLMVVALIPNDRVEKFFLISNEQQKILFL